jgi:hypothetical protein
MESCKHILAGRSQSGAKDAIVAVLLMRYPIYWMLLAQMERDLRSARDMVREMSEWRKVCDRFYRKSG